VSPLRYELGFYIPEDGILQSHRRENLKTYIVRNHFVHVTKNGDGKILVGLLLLGV
jgi:hypothetical protein